VEDLITVNQQPYRALESDARKKPLVVMDIGYSARQKSCGIIWDEQEKGDIYRFGTAIGKVADKLQEDDFADAVLVLEAPLSTYHDEDGNPQIRTPAEKGRGWYYGPGAMTLQAARRFLWQLAPKLPDNGQLPLAEAFLSNKSGPTPDEVDAKQIRDGFWGAAPEPLEPSCEPIISLIDGIPPVRVF